VNKLQTSNLKLQGNSKSQAANSKKIPSSKFQSARWLGLEVGAWGFIEVWDLGFEASNR
jgi:hypothetical protein